jgi:Phage integrase, N-terminal SAM-like domain
MDQMREVFRSYRHAYRTERTYGHWILRHLHDCGDKTPPNGLGTNEVERVRSHLATEGQVSASTEGQALNQSTADWCSETLRKTGQIEVSAIQVYQCHAVRLGAMLQSRWNVTASSAGMVFSRRDITVPGRSRDAC